MKNMKQLFWLLAFFILSCTPPTPLGSGGGRMPVNLTPIPPSDLQYHYIGKKVVFTRTSDEMIQYYKSSDGWLNSTGFYKSYESLVGKNGVVKGIMTDGLYRYYTVQMSDGTELFQKDYWGRNGNDYGHIEKTYFISDLDEAKKSYIGRTIWLFNIIDKRDSPDEPFVYKNIFNDNEIQWTDFKKFEKVKVVDVIPFSYGKTYAASSFWLLIKSMDGSKKGYIRHDNGSRDYQHYLEEEPFEPSWDEDLIQIIKDQKIKIGMTSKQVMLSWGKPEDINRTVTTYGTSEQWVYGMGTYVYFENGTCTSYQN